MGELKPGDVVTTANGGSATITANLRERAPPGETFTTYNFEVAEFHTYFVGAAGVWVHNFSDKFCDDLASLTEVVRKKLGISELKGRRMEILEEAMNLERAADKVIPSEGANRAFHVAQLEEFAEYSGDLSSIASAKKLKQLRTKLDLEPPKSGGFDIHHTSEKWMSEALGVPADKLDDCPGMPMRRQKDPAFDSQYEKDFGHAPAYHGSVAGDDGLANKLQKIRLRFETDPGFDEARMLEAVRTLYTEPPYESLKMWTLTRDWLRANASNPAVIPD